MIDADNALRRERLYGRRVGKPLRAQQQSLLETRLASLSVPMDDAIDLHGLFPGRTQFAFEVGFGGGEHLAAQAGAHPTWGFIGCEPFINGAAKLVKQVVEEKIDNVRLCVGDAREVMPRLPAASLEAFYLLYPDPWPKLRHHKRRFVNQSNLNMVARLLRPGGELRIATDIPDYARWSLEHLMQHSAFRWCAEHAADWRNRPDDWPATRYEQKALKAGRHGIYLRFIRL